MTEPVQPTPEQLAALDTLIEGMERGEITPTELAQTLQAAPAAQQQGGGGNAFQRAVGGFGAANFGLTVTVAMIFGALENGGPPAAAHTVPEEITLDDLIALRRRLTAE